MLGLCFTGFIHAQTTLSGVISNQKGEPLTDALIFLLPIQKGTTTDANGQYQYKNLQAGDYTLQVSMLGYAQKEMRISIENSQPEQAFSLQLSPSSYLMDEMIVQSTRANEQTPMTYTNLDKEALETRNLGQDVPFLLRWTPSAIVTSDAGAGVGYTGIRIRGTDPTRINVTINGIPLNDAESQGVFWVNMPDFASSVSDVQVQRGVGSSSNGAGAFGATINLNTVKLQPESFASINTSVGSFNTFRRNVQFGTGLINDKFTIDGRLSKITSDGYIDRASSDLSSYYVSAAYVGDRSMLRFNTFSGHEITYQAWYGVAAELVDDRDTRTTNVAGLEKTGEPHDNEVDDYRQTHYQLLFNHQLAPNTNANISLHYTQGEGFFEQYKADQDLAAYGFLSEVNTSFNPDLIRRLWLDNDYYGAVYSLNTSKNRLDFTLGGGYNIYEGRHFGEIVWSELADVLEPEQVYYDNDARKTDFNIYTKFSYALSQKLEAYLDLQLRRVGYEFLGFDIDGNNVTQDDQLTFFNPKLGVFYDLGNQTNAYASFAVAQREPNRNDYVESTPNSRPRAEQLYDTELGYRKTGKKGAFEATAYFMYYIDQLALNGQLNDVGAATRINIDESYRLGLELNGGYQLTNQLRLDAGTTLSRNKVVAFDEFVDLYFEDGSFDQAVVSHEDTDLSFSPSLIASFGITWQPFKEVESFAKHDFSISLLNKYVSRQYLDNTSDENNVIDPYTFTDLQLDLNLGDLVGENIRVSLLVQNVFDALYVTNGWSYRSQFEGVTSVLRGYYPQATRNYLLGVNLTF